MKRIRLPEGLVRFFKIMKTLSWAQRIDYIITYYKEILFVSAVAIMLISAIFFSVFTGDNREVMFCGVFVNTDINSVGHDYLDEGVMDLFGWDEKTQKVDLSATHFGEVKELSQLDYAYNAAMKAIALLEKGTLDYLVMDEIGMKFYMTQYALTDLRDVFTQQELEKMEDQLIYFAVSDEQERYPVAIDVTNMQFFHDCIDTSVPMYFSFTGDKEDAAAYRSFWAYLNAWTTP